MSRKDLLFVFAVSLLFFGAVAGFAYAATDAGIGDSCATGGDGVCGENLRCIDGYCQAALGEGPAGAGDVFRVLAKVGNYFFAFFMAASLFFIVWAAYLFVSGAGNPARLQEAKQRIVFAVIGIIIALLAVFFDDIIASFISVS